MIEIQILCKQGKSLKAIAKQTGYSINTVRKYARDHAEPAYRKRPMKPQKLDGYREYLQERLRQAYPAWLPATVLFREIVQRGYRGEISLLRAYLRTLKPVLTEKPIIRFETAPGEQMQVDFAYFREQETIFYAFLALLSYSRMLYVEFVANQTLETLLACHEHMFTYFSGVPRQVVYDNMKTVVVQRDAYGKGQHRLQPGFLDFAKHHRFVPILCRPYHPQSKGKIERMVHYLRHSFFHPWISHFRTTGQTFSLEVLNAAAHQWLDTVANVRCHGDLKEQPVVRFQRESGLLQPLPNPYLFRLTPSHMTSCLVRQHDLSLYDNLCQEVTI